MIVRVFFTIKNIIDEDIYDSFNITKIIIATIIILFFTFMLSFNFQDDTYHPRLTEPGTSLLDIEKVVEVK